LDGKKYEKYEKHKNNSTSISPYRACPTIYSGSNASTFNVIQMKIPEKVSQEVGKILSVQNLPNRLQSRAFRFRAGKLGVASMIEILEENGWTVTITIKKIEP